MAAILPAETCTNTWLIYGQFKEYVCQILTVQLKKNDASSSVMCVGRHSKVGYRIYCDKTANYGITSHTYTAGLPYDEDDV